MNLQKHTIEEKFEMLSFLQRNLKIGSFLLTRLKKTNTYQISFINGSSLKVRNADLNICLEDVIVDIAEYYHDTFQTDFYTDFLIKAEREFQEMQTKQIRELNSTILKLTEEINELKDNYSRDIVNQSKTGFYNGETNSFIPDNVEGYLDNDNLSENQKEIKRIMGVFDDVMEDLKKDYSNGSKLFSEYTIYKEIVRKHDKFKRVDDVIEFKKEFPKEFKKVRSRAYDRLYKRKRKNK